MAFEHKKVTVYGDYFVDVVAHDLNADKRPDLVASDSRGRLRLLLNKGAARLVRAATYPIPTSLEGLAVSDLDRDGDPDIAVAGEGKQEYPDHTRSNGGVWLLRNDGGARFAPPVRYATDRQSRDLAIGDLNEDGWPDLVVANSVPGQDPPPGGGVSVLFNAGDGTFGPPHEPTRFTRPNVVALADMNVDGHADVLTSYLSVLLGRGDGTFAEPVGVRLPELWGIEVVNLDADRYPDVVAGVYSERYDIAILRGGPGGRLEQPQFAKIGDWRGAATSSGLVIGSFDRAPGPDLALADYEGLYIASGIRQASLRRPVRYRYDFGGAALAAADFDSDGRNDVAAVDNSGRVQLFLNRGEGRRASLRLPAQAPFRIAADRTVHVLLRCGRGVGRCAGTLRLARGGRLLGSARFDLPRRTEEWVRVPAARAGYGPIHVETRTELATRRRSTSIVAPSPWQRRAACRPSGSRTLASSRIARVFAPRNTFRVVIGCMYAVGALVDFRTEYADGPFAASRHYAAFVGRDFCEADSCLINMHVFDLRARRYLTVDGTTVRRCSLDFDCGTGQLGRIVISSRGAVAWTACPQSVERCPRRPKARVEVYRIDRRGLRRVAHRRRIDPYSLRLVGGDRIVWHQAGRKRSAGLRGTPPPAAACSDEFKPYVPRACPRLRR